MSARERIGRHWEELSKFPGSSWQESQSPAFSEQVIANGVDGEKRQTCVGICHVNEAQLLPTTTASVLEIQEFCDYLVDFLYSSPRGLRCALVSPSLVSSAQYHLFYEI
jgi:hypothetical protein